MFGVIAGLGLGLTATKYVAEFREKNPDKAGRIISLSNWLAAGAGGLITMGLLAKAPWLATRALAAPHLAGLLKVGAPLLFLGAINGAQTGALSGFEAFNRIARVNLYSGIASFPFMLGGTILFGLPGAVWGLVASAITNCILNYIALRREATIARVPITLSGARQEISLLWTYSLPALLGGIVVGPVTWGCNAILVNQPNGYAEMGALNAANQMFTALTFVPIVLVQVMLPILSERLGDADILRSKRILTASIKLNAIVVFPLVLVGSLFSPVVMSIFGTGFRNAWPTLVFTLLAAGLFSIQLPVGTVIQAAGKMWIGALMNLGWALAFLTGTFLMARNGSMGLSLARAAAYVLHAVWTFSFALHIIRSK